MHIPFIEYMVGHPSCSFFLYPTSDTPSFRSAAIENDKMRYFFMEKKDFMFNNNLNNFYHRKFKQKAFESSFALLSNVDAQKVFLKMFSVRTQASKEQVFLYFFENIEKYTSKIAVLELLKIVS